MAAKQNVVMIVSDTFRRDHLGAYGNTWIHTPNLDRLAAESVVFDEHMTSSFPTMPARADFLTAMHSYTHMGWEPLPGHLETLPAHMSEAGYLTMGVVDTPFFVRDRWGYDRGFDDFIWVRGQGDEVRPAERVDVRMRWVHETERLAPRTMLEAESWLERHYRERFFLYVDTWDPHEPWDAPDYYTALYRPDYNGTQIYPPYGKWQEAGLSEDDVALAHDTYCGEITMVDRWIGHLLSKLDVLGIADNTIVIFTSDHGFYFGEHGYIGKAEWTHTPGAKVSSGAEVPMWFARSWLLTLGWSPLYRELINVPLFVRVPGYTAGRQSALTTAPDIPATILDLVGIEPMASAHGLSFGSVLKGHSRDHRPLVVSSWPLYFAEGEITSAVDSRPRRIAQYMPITVTTRDFSLIIGGPTEAPELYDRERDPGQSTNVWTDRVVEGTALFEQALEFLRDCGADERHLIPRRKSLSAFGKVAGMT